jgi:hypothetical protein
MHRLAALALVTAAGCHTEATPLRTATPVAARAEDPIGLEEQARTDLEAAEALIQALESQPLSEPQLERLMLSRALVADAFAALDAGNATRAAQLAAKALGVAQGVLEG